MTKASAVSRSSSAVSVREAWAASESPAGVGGKRRPHRAQSDSWRCRESAAIQAFLQRQSLPISSAAIIRSEALSRCQALPPLLGSKPASPHVVATLDEADVAASPPATTGISPLLSRGLLPRHLHADGTPHWGLASPTLSRVPSATMATLASDIVRPRVHEHGGFGLLCGFGPSEQSGIDTLLRVLSLGPEDVFYDLGCGDGRIVMSVVKRFGCRGVGVDLNGALIKNAAARASKELRSLGLQEDRVTFLQQDIALTPLKDASAIYVYMPQAAVNTVFADVLPSTGLRDNTLVFIEENRPQGEKALSHLRWKATHWKGQLYCYEWQELQSATNTTSLLFNQLRSSAASAPNTRSKRREWL